MVFVTGDTHGYINVSKLQIFAKEHPELTKNDYVIVAGDFGGLFYPEHVEAFLDIYSELPFTVLFVDGNHENFNLLYSYPVSMWHGGKVHIIRQDIIHLMRGQIYEIEGKTFFTFGGATSIDRQGRRKNVDWWEQELPTYEEMDEGVENLRMYKNKVDFIITHSCDEKALWYSPLRMRTSKLRTYPENIVLSEFEKIVDYGHWFFGHYHMDGDLTDRKTVLFNEIRQII